MHQHIYRAKRYPLTTLHSLSAQIPPDYKFEFRARPVPKGLKLLFIVAVYGAAPSAKQGEARQEFLGYL